MKLTNRIYIIGSGNLGMQLSHDRDCNVYVVDCGESYALLDAGSGLDPASMIRHAEEDGIDLNKVSHLLLTHAHGDHAAGAYYYQNQYNLQVVAAAEASPWVEAGDLQKTSLAAAITAGVYPPDFEFPPCPVSIRVNENDQIRVGEVTFTVVETPGHSRGHVSYLCELEGLSHLFSGDTVFAGGKVVIQNIWDCFIGEYAQTVAKLHRFRIDRLFPGHGAFLMKDAWKHIELAHNDFEKLAIPPNL